MPPSQQDYSGSDSQLVPGALTAYRHFYMQTHSPPSLYGDGRHVVPRLISMNTRKSIYSGGGSEPFSAKCYRGGVYSALSSNYANAPRPGHKSPDVECTCGFYAHYDPATDFYESMTWTDPVAYYSSEHQELRYGTNMPSTVSFIEPNVAVRAVIEVSGTVVMGSLGVRAEKMRIVAVAVDYDKYLSVTRERRMKPFRLDWETVFDPDLTPFLPDLEYEDTVVTRLGKPTDEERSRFDRQAQTLAEEHGARWYASAKEMYAAHPKPDLAALGIEEKTQRQVEEERVKRISAAIWGSSGAVWGPKPSAPKQSVWDAYQAAMQSLQQAAYTAKDSLALLDESTLPSKKPKVKTRPPLPPDPYQQVLDAKKSKPAPPGAGIDRRKRKL